MTRTVRTAGLLAALTILMLATVLTGCAADESDTIAPEPPAENGAQAPEADGARVLVESKCSGCHPLAQVWAADYDRAGWETTVSRMEANGLQVTAEERETIIDYLAEN